MDKYKIIVITLFVMLFCMGSVMAQNTDSIDLNQTADDMSVDSNPNLLKTTSEDAVVDESSDEVVVENWEELQLYSSYKDKNYVLKLKENTNYYPKDPSDVSNQIILNNNVTILGASGAYIGDSSPNARNINYAAMLVPDNNGVGITVKNVLFKWIGTYYQPDGIFIQMGGNSVNYFENCYFTNISTNIGHSSILHIKTGDAVVKNCTFVNCTTDFGCMSVYNPNDDATGTCLSARMNVTDSYFEGNYARTEPGCINNCGVLIVTNSIFYKNSAFWWAGAIHTHGGANTTIYDSDFIDNLAGWNGGALYTYSYLQIYNTRFIGNNCTTNNGGGAIGACKYLHAPYIIIKDSLFTNNENLCWSLDEQSTSGTGRGGAISFMDEGSLEVYNSTFVENCASIGTAICAINGGLSYGSPDIKIIGNKFINHTRVGDVLNVRVATGSILDISDNYYLNNSIEFSKLKLSADDPDASGRVTLHVDAALKNPNSYDSDILDKSGYNVYVNGAYEKTVLGRTFTLDLGRGNNARVYVVPSISNSKSNEVFAGKVKEYIYVSQKSGNDNNNGLTRSSPVKTLNRSIELARSAENIIIMDGTFTETDLIIDYNLTITGESDATITVNGMGFKITDGDVLFENLTFKDSKYGSATANRIISQSSTGFLTLKGCDFENNQYTCLIDASGSVEAENLKFIENTACLFYTQSLVIKSSIITRNIANTNSKNEALFKYKTQTNKFIAENLTFLNNDVLKGCIYLKGSATITECNFINNYISASSNQRSSGINIESGSVVIESCNFINSTDKGSNAAVIYNSGTVVVKDSIFLNNYYENSKGIISGSSAGLKKITANYNWWGNTLQDLSKPNLYVTSGWDPVQYWLILNATSLSNELELNMEVPVQFMFTQIDNEGNVTSYDGYKLPGFDLTLTAVNGTCPDSKITVENGMAITYFTLTKLSDSSLTGTYNGVSATINFTSKCSIPDVNISAEDILVGDTANIVVSLPSAATGNVTLRVGNTTKTEEVKNSKATFSISGLPAGNYTVEANYTGNEIFISTVQTANLTVNKHNSTTELSHGDIDVDKDAVFTITLSNGATGTVDIYVNDVKETIDVGQTYTIPNISRGDYVVRAVYGGDSYYLGSEDEITFDVGKLIPTISVTAPDVTYGEDTVVTVNLDDDATGNITVTVDGKTNTSKLDGGKATVSISGINAGEDKVINIDYSGDQNYMNATATKTYNVNKASLDFTINSNDIKLGQSAVVTIQLPQRSGGTLTITGIKTETKNIPLTGLVTVTYSDLTVGTYTVSAQYDGDNYQTVSKSTTFEVTDWTAPQWPNQGYDIKNTEKSPYSTEANGNVKWIKDIDGTVTGNMAIDSEGRIYVTTTDGIYSINPNDGSTNWIFNSQDAGNDFSGIAISRDVILVSKSGDKLYFINQTTGEQYHNNMYQGSSVFAPIVDNEGNIYVSGEYYSHEASSDVVIIPYKIWQTSTAPTSISIGNNELTSSPVLVNDDIIIVTTANRLIGISISSKSILFSNPISCDSNPVVGMGNITYIISNGHVVSFDNSGSKINDIPITGNAGNYLSVGINGEIFSINRQGKLFDYSIGEETLIYDFNESVSSRLLVGQDDMLYVGTDSGMFYAIDVEGNLLWKVNLNQSISTSQVMDENGVIYLISGNRLIALDNGQLKDSKLSADIKNVTYGQNVTVDIELDEEATGVISINVGSYNNESSIDGGKVSFLISDLSAGNYSASINYNGDNRFKSKNIVVKFTVSKIDPTMDVNFNNIEVGDVLEINVSDLPGDSEGTVSAIVDNKQDSADILNGNANLKISGLEKGEYSVVVTYSGDTNYNEKTITKPVSVGYVQTSFNAVSSNINVGQDALINISGLENDANGVFYVNYNNMNYTCPVENGNAQIKITDLANGTYDFDVFYINDTKYSANSQKVSIIVSKITPTFVVSLNDNINVGEDLNVDVTGLPDDATGFIVVSIEVLSENVTVSDGKAKVTVHQNLANGTYTVNVTYTGDKKYNKINELKTIQISKIAPQFIISINDINVGDDLVVNVSGLPDDATGQVNVSINEISNVSSIKDGESTVVLHQRLANGTYIAVVSYSGDDKYNSLKESKSVKISKITPNMNVVVKDKINVGDVLVIDVSGLPNDTAVKYVEVIGDLVDRGLINQGTSKIVISNLTSGEYSFTVYFNGDDRYEMVKSDLSVSVNKMSPEMKVIVNNVDVGEDLIIQVKLPDEITDEFVYISINDDIVPIKVINGNATYNVPDLTKGTYNCTVSYEGNDKYTADEYNKIVEVGKISIDYNVTIEDISYGEPATVNIFDLPNDASGNVTVIVNKKMYSVNATGSSVVVNIPDLGAGEYTAEVRYFDVKYMANSKYVSFNVTKADPVIVIAAEAIKYGEPLHIDVNLSADATGSVLISVSGISKTVEIKEGIASVDIGNLTAGVKTIAVDYDGDDNYCSASASKQITVSKLNTALIILADDIEYGENLVVSVNLDNRATGNVTVSVEDISQSAKIIDGVATTTISSLTIGLKTINVNYDGDTNFNPTTSSKNITVTKSGPSIIAPLDVKIIDKSKVDISILNATGSVSVILDGVENVLLLDNDGNASLDLKDLTPGNHTVIVVYDGDDTYKSAYNVSNLNIPGEPAAVPIYSKFGDYIINDDFTVIMSLKDKYGNEIANSAIKYYVNGVLGSTITDSKGLVTIVAKASAVINVIYDGDDKYVSANASLTLNNPAVPSVVQVDSHFNISGGVITIKGYVVDLDAGEEGIYFTTQLLDVNEAAIKGVPIQFVSGNEIYDKVTIDDGSFDPYKFNMINEGRYTSAFFFKGNDKYSSAFGSVCVDLAKKPITIKASAKTYKASATKKYSTLQKPIRQVKLHLNLN